jgi:hypothetical protein
LYGITECSSSAQGDHRLPSDQHCRSTLADQAFVRAGASRVRLGSWAMEHSRDLATSSGQGYNGLQ